MLRCTNLLHFIIIIIIKDAFDNLLLLCPSAPITHPYVSCFDSPFVGNTLSRRWGNFMYGSSSFNPKWDSVITASRARYSVCFWQVCCRHLGDSLSSPPVSVPPPPPPPPAVSLPPPPQPLRPEFMVEQNWFDFHYRPLPRNRESLSALLLYAYACPRVGTGETALPCVAESVLFLKVFFIIIFIFFSLSQAFWISFKSLLHPTHPLPPSPTTTKMVVLSFWRP